MINRIQLQALQLSKKLLTLFAVIVIIDIFTRLIIISPQVSQPDFSKEISLNKESTLLKDSQWQQINDILSEFKPKAIEVVEATEEKIIQTKALSEQGGLQNELFVQDYKIELLAIVNEQNGKQFVVLNETYLINDSAKVVKYENNDKVHSMQLIISSMTEVQFSHPELSRNVVIKMYSNKKKSSE